jgi:hypothetical protein
MTQSGTFRIALYTGVATAFGLGTILAVLLDNVPVGALLGLLLGLVAFALMRRRRVNR